jgi:hypothetical protein
MGLTQSSPRDLWLSDTQPGAKAPGLFSRCPFGTCPFEAKYLRTELVVVELKWVRRKQRKSVKPLSTSGSHGHAQA